MTPFYAVLYQTIRDVGLRNGYAVAIHGSVVRDLDVIAVPWVDSAQPYDVFVADVCNVANLRVVSTGRKPHGRLVFALGFPDVETPAYVDLSVIPPT